MTDINLRIEEIISDRNRQLAHESGISIEEQLKSLFKELVEEIIGEAKPEVFGHCTEHRKGSYICNPCLYIGIGKQLVDKYENSMRFKREELLGGKDK